MAHRRRRNAPIWNPSWAHGSMRYGRKRNPQRNPGIAGVSGTTLLLLGGAAFVLFTPSGKAMLSRLHIGGSAALPPGYVTVGNNLYRGPDGALYARNPQTGALVRAPAGAVPTSGSDLLAKAEQYGIALLPKAGAAVMDWLGGLFKGGSSATTIPGSIPPVDVGTAPLDPGVSPWPTDPALPPLVPDYTLWPSGPLDYSLPIPLDYSLPTLPPIDTFYPQVDYALVPPDPGVPAFFGLGTLPPLHPGPLPYIVNWKGGAQFLRRPASRI